MLPEPGSCDQHAVYGAIPQQLVAVPAGSLQCSPRVPGAHDLSNIEPASLAGIIMHAPSGTIERRHAIALALRALKPGTTFTVFAANKKGGTRLARELANFGCVGDASPKRHHQIVDAIVGENLVGLDEAISAGEPQLLPQLGLWTQPGLFSWDRIDPGSRLLLDHLPKLAGTGADLGCGYGLLAQTVVSSEKCTKLYMIDIDSRALEMARRNNPDDKVEAGESLLKINV